MPELLPKFANPPVVETVLSSQFDRLPAYRIAHAGSFWQTYLDEWKDINEAARLQDTFERFGEDRQWGYPGIRFFSSPEIRTQIVSPDNTRMVQVQDSRFVYNWKRVQVAYPSFETICREFDEHYNEFKDFVGRSGIGAVAENQWEVSYINHLPKGELWNSAGEWPRIFPWLTFPSVAHSKPDYLQGEWSSVIGENLGRLHTNLAFGRTALTGPESIILTLTARGGVSSTLSKTVADGLSLGREVIVRSFAEMTSDWAHARWGRTQ